MVGQSAVRIDTHPTLPRAIRPPIERAVALSSAGVLEALREADPLLPARIRGLRDRERLLSAFGGAVGAVEAVLAAVDSDDAWSKLAFMVNPEDRLGGDPPVAVLQRCGKDAIAAVVAAVQASGEHGAS
jgi:hypothetical protein